MTTSEPVAFDAEKENLILDAVERFVDREIKPVAQRLEHADEWPADIVAGMRDMGLFGCMIREEYGGLGVRRLDNRVNGTEQSILVGIKLRPEGPAVISTSLKTTNSRDPPNPGFNVDE